MSDLDFKIEKKGVVSSFFLSLDITSFSEGCVYVRSLPYKRNSNKEDLCIVLKERFGTCSTKHALLRELAGEHGRKEVKLMLGIFKMSTLNTPSVKDILLKYKLEYIPEAHNYLRVAGKIVDCTKTGFGPDNFASDLISEIEILPTQTASFKVDYHKKFLEEWLIVQKEPKQNLDELWEIREKCIAQF